MDGDVVLMNCNFHSCKFMASSSLARIMAVNHISYNTRPLSLCIFAVHFYCLMYLWSGSCQHQNHGYDHVCPITTQSYCVVPWYLIRGNNLIGAFWIHPCLGLSGVQSHHTMIIIQGTINELGVYIRNWRLWRVWRRGRRWRTSVHIFFILTFYRDVGHEKLIYLDGHNMTHRLL